MPQNNESDDRLVEIDNAIDEIQRARERSPSRESLERAHRELQDAIDAEAVDEYLKEGDEK